MSRRSSSPRFAVATAGILICGLLAGAPSAAGRDPGHATPAPAERKLISSEHPERMASLRTVGRVITVRDLPKSRGLESPYVPDLRGPVFHAAAAPDIAALAATPPTEATLTGHPPAAEPTVLDGLADASGSEPPDPWVATGPEHIIQAVNTTFRVSDRAGATQATVDMFEFFALGDFYDPGDVAYFDPRVIYDSLHGRWVAIEASFDCFAGDGYIGTGYLDIALSDSADAMGGWQIFSIPFAGYLPDYPGIGTSTDKIALSSNLFSLVPGGALGCQPQVFSGTEIDVIAWSEFLGSGAINVDYLWSQNFEGGAFPNLFFTWRPALQTPATSATIFAIAERFDEGVAYATITGTPAGGASTTITIKDLTALGVIDPFAAPPQPQQPGAPATITGAVNARPTDAVWQGNRLLFVSTYPCDPAGGAVEERDCVRVSELGTSTATPTLTQDMLIAEDGADHYMGGVGFAGNGDLHVAWTRSSETAGQYPSSYTAYQLSTDAPGELTPPELLAAGTGTYPGTRWGDYVGVAQDPQVPNAVWQGNQFSAGGSYWDTHVSQLQTGGSSYVPMTPLRVVDSRTNTGVAGIFTSGVPKTFQVAGTGSIPADAVAVTGNVTVVGQTGAGYVSITPDATTTPASSTINFPLGDIRANNFTSPLNATGKLSAVYKAGAGRKSHVIVDITGYFLFGTSAATYQPLTDPVRIIDTRPLSHVGPLSTFVSGVTQTMSVAGLPDIPPEATAITGNITVVNQTRAGYVSVTPEDPAGTPTSSTINFPVGDVRANGLTADLNVDGDLSITYIGAGGTVNILLDVTGYYLPNASGLLFYPLNPGRVLDTRAGIVLTGLAGTFTANVARTLDVDAHWGVPAGAAAITGNLTVVGQTAAGYVAVTPAFVDPPLTSSLNFPRSDIRANGITVPLSGGGTPGNAVIVYKAGAGRTTHLLLDLTGYFK